MSERACMFTGHRELDTDITVLENAVIAEINRAVDDGITVFYAGGAVGFDALAASCVLKVKKERSVKLVICVPFIGQEHLFNADQKREYNRILLAADSCICMNAPDKHSAYFLRDRYMADRSERCICYKKHSRGGTAYTVNYAFSRGVKIVNLAGAVNG